MRATLMGRLRPLPALAIVVLVAAAIGGVSAQPPTQVSVAQAIPVFEASGSSPPEEAVLNQAIAGARAVPQRVRPTIEELIDQIGRQPGGRERLNRAGQGARPEQVITAAAGPAPEAVKSGFRQAPKPRVSVRPSLAELEAAITAAPGGREKLERARQGGRPDRAPPQASRLQRTQLLLAGLPALIGTANAYGTAAASAHVNVTLTPQISATTGRFTGLSGNTATASGTLTARVALRGVTVSEFLSGTDYLYLTPHNNAWTSSTSSRIERPYVSLSLGVPSDGYYIVSVRADAAAGVQLYRYAGATAVSNIYTLVQSFSTAALDRPALVYLARGGHTFYWVFPSTTSFYSASIDSYP